MKHRRRPLGSQNPQELTSRYSVSFYDAPYHALALVHQGLFVTADILYVGRVAEPGSVISLRAWMPPL